MLSNARAAGFAREQFALDSTWTFLNHGSYGAVPASVRAEQTRWRNRIEAQPVDFLARRWWSLVQEARIPVARFLGSRPQDIAFISNATAGVQAVVRSLELNPGDQIVTTSHRYDAVHRILHHACERAGAQLIEVLLPASPAPDAVETAILECCTPSTRLAVLDAVTSPTAVALPIHTLTPRLREHGIRVLVDGAHAPGLVDVDLGNIQPDYWVGNLHKWICAPRGTAVIYVDPTHQQNTHAPITSHGHGLGFHAEFDWTGTFDPSGWLSAPAAIAQHEAWRGNNLRLSHRMLATHYREHLLDALGLQPQGNRLHPTAMVAVPLGAPGAHARTAQQWLAARRVEVPVIAWAGEAFVRVSAFAAYNQESDIDQLIPLLPGLRRVLTTGEAD